MSHADILDQGERLRGYFWGSVLLHVGIAGALVAYNVVSNNPRMPWGSRQGGGFGSVSVNPVAQIPLPRSAGAENPVANPTKSEVPAPPKAKPAVKPAPKTKAPEPDAISLKSKKTAPTHKKSSEDVPVHREQQATTTPNKFRETQRDTPNQLYGSSGPALSSPMMGKPGSGQLGYGNSTPFGEQLGWYANILQDHISQHWRTDDVPPQVRAAPQVIVTFALKRDGTIDGVPHIKQSSGIAALDYSAQRAVVEAAPFPQIPAQFPRNSAQVEFIFELRR